MLSICIPIYNFDVAPLVNDLCQQITANGLFAEIVLIDDCSDEKFRSVNQFTHPLVKLIQLDENIGRSRIRNLFLKYAKKEYLLFLDCDSLVVSDNFLKRYTEFISKNHKQVICGGRIYPETKPDRNHILRWKYGHIRESQNADTRSRHPNKSFMTNNFLINRTILETISFNEKHTGYGHEDTLFGYHLKQKEIEIVHIENPILNGDIEDNTLFIKKTEQGVENLKEIYILNHSNAGFEDDVNLLRANRQLIKWHLKSILEVLFLTFRKPVKWLLKKGVPSLTIFNFYKIGYLNHLLIKSN